MQAGTALGRAIDDVISDTAEKREAIQERLSLLRALDKEQPNPRPRPPAQARPRQLTAAQWVPGWRAAMAIGVVSALIWGVIQ